MTELLLVSGLAVIMLVLAGIYSLHSSRGETRQAIGQKRLDAALARIESGGQFVTAQDDNDWVPPIFDHWLQRAGLIPGKKIYILLLSPLAILLLLAVAVFGLLQGIVVAFFAHPLLLALFLQWRIERFSEQTVALLPDLLDSIARILSVGCSLEMAFRNAGDECHEPLRGIVSLVLLKVHAGLALEDAMGQVAEVYQIRELNFVASVFYLGIRYGGNAQAVIERISRAMRERERSAKELKAMTSETRASAWILGALPIVVAVLTISSNPGYLLGMWADPDGKRLLLAALALQVCGSYLLFRMSRMK